MPTPRLALLVTIVGLMSAQSESPSPLGWTTAQWGMTEDQVQANFPDAQKGMLSSVHILTLHGFKIESVEYSVLFGFEAGKLTIVRLTQEPSSSPQVTAQIARDTLLSGLRNKYGKEAASDETPRDHSVIREYHWAFPKTTIALFWISHREPAYQQNDLTYVQYSERKQNDKL